MAKDPAYPMYAQDFDMDTAAWSALAIGIYVRLLNYSWVNGPIPDDTEELSRIARLDHGNFKKSWCRYVKPKWMKKDGGLINRRLEEEREKRALYIEEQREKGKKSARKRWGEDVTTVTTTVKPELQPEGLPESKSSFSSSLKEKDIKQRATFVPDPVDNSNPTKKDLTELFLKAKDHYPSAGQLREVQKFIELRSNGNIKAVKYCLRRLSEEAEKGKPVLFIGRWLEKIMKDEEPIYNARDSEEECNAHKRDLTSMADIFRGMPK